VPREDYVIVIVADHGSARMTSRRKVSGNYLKASRRRELRRSTMNISLKFNLIYSYTVM
jgi:hypothetical protein